MISLMGTARAVAFGSLMVVGVGFNAPTSAAVISGTYDVTATDFILNNAPNAPIDPALLNFTVTFDNSASFDATTANLTINSINVPVGSTIQYEYQTTFDQLTLGGQQNGIGGISTGNDFVAMIRNASSANPTLDAFTYHFFTGVFYISTSGTVTFTPDDEEPGPGPGPVPEPSSLILLATAMLGAKLFRHRRKAG